MVIIMLEISIKVLQTLYKIIIRIVFCVLCFTKRLACLWLFTLLFGTLQAPPCQSPNRSVISHMRYLTYDILLTFLVICVS